MKKSFNTTPENDVSINIIKKGPDVLSEEEINRLIDDNPFGLQTNIKENKASDITSHKKEKYNYRETKKEKKKEIREITSSPSQNPLKKININKSELTPTQLYDLLLKVREFNTNDLKYILTVLEQTQMGTIDDVWISRDQFIEAGIQTGKINDCKIRCNSIISIKEGRKPGSKGRQVSFFSLK